MRSSGQDNGHLIAWIVATKSGVILIVLPQAHTE